MADFTEAQKTAITRLERNMVVAAGAGSGKTRVLVERYVHILDLGRLDPAKTVPATEILAVTFTRKAATEMRERVGRIIREKIVSGQDGAYWNERLKELSRAQIGTLHSFCSNLIRSNPVECGLDPNFTVAEDTEATEFIQEATREILRENLREEDPATLALCEEYGSTRMLEQMATLLVREMPGAEEDLVAPYKALLEELEEARTELVRTTWDEVEADLKAGNKNHKVLSACWDEFHDALEAVEEPASRAFLLDVRKQLGKRGSQQEKDRIEWIRNGIDRIMEIPLMRRACELMPSWQSFLDGLKRDLRARKLERSLLTFDDLEEMALELLQTHPAVLRKVRGMYRYVMVDEFQDTNSRQRKLIYLISNRQGSGGEDRLGPEGLFVVGDPKQSIYRFRGADVSVFRKVREEIRDSGGHEVLLKDNFRTAAPILDFCNGLFPFLMGDGTLFASGKGGDAGESGGDGGVEYEPLDPNKTGKEVPVLCLAAYEKEEKPLSTRKEAEWLAELIRDQKESGSVSDGEGGTRPAGYGDMAVLMQTMTQVGLLEEVFSAAGIPYAVVDGRGFYDRIEIRDLVTLFNFVVSPRENKYLLGLLRSVYFGIDDITLTSLCLLLGARKKREEDLRQIMEEPGGEEAEACSLADLSLWRLVQDIADRKKDGMDETGDLELEELEMAPEQERLLLRGVEILRRLCREAALLNLQDFCNLMEELLLPETVLALQPGGPEKVADYGKFREIVRQYTVSRQGDVSGFAAYLETMREINRKEAAATVDAPEAVQILTIHKSKGLEFPLVFLPFLSRSGRGDTDMVKYLSGPGLGIKLHDGDNRLADSPVLSLIKRTDKALNEAEKIRLLYVAMTRAEEKLFLLGSVAAGDEEDGLKKPGKSSDLLNRIRLALPACKDLVETRVRRLEEISIPEGEREESRREIDLEALLARTEPLPDYGSRGMTWFSASALQEYEFCPRRYYYQDLERITPLDMEVESGDRLPASRLGNLVHSVLEQMAKSFIYSEEGPAGTVYRNRMDRIGTADLERFYANAVREFAGGNFTLAQPGREMLERYLASPLYREFASRQIMAEWGFQLPLLTDGERTFHITGFVDAMGETESGGLEIVDYKTGRPPADGEAKAGYAWQLQLYKMAVEKVFGRPVEKASLHFLQNCSAWVMPDQDYEQEILELCNGIAGKKREEEYPAETGKCLHCPFEYMCRK